MVIGVWLVAALELPAGAEYGQVERFELRAAFWLAPAVGLVGIGVLIGRAVRPPRRLRDRSPLDAE
jgi:hypothetical protein